MSVQKYPRLVSIYSGEERFMIIPSINHIGGYSIDSEHVKCITETDNKIIGESILATFSFIENSPLSDRVPNKNPTWKKGSKYKGYTTFWKHNLMAYSILFEDGSYEIYSTEKSREKKGLYNGCIKSIKLSANATAEDIGNAIIDVFKAAEEYYEQNPMNY